MEDKENIPHESNKPFDLKALLHAFDND